MIKKISSVLLIMLISVSFISCGADNGGKESAPSYSFTQKSTLIHNYFKEKLPDYDFKNEPVEKYRDGVSYTLSVSCSLKEFQKYVKKLKKAGFEENITEAETYFSANTADGYFVEAMYVVDMLTVSVKKT